MAETPEDGRAVPVVWIDRPDPRADYATHFLIVTQPNEFVVWAGQAQVPPILGDEDERRAQVQAVSHVPIHAVSKLVTSRQALIELRSVIDDALSRTENAHG